MSGASDRASSHRPTIAASASTNAARGCGFSDPISRHTAASSNSTLGQWARSLLTNITDSPISIQAA
jgi:hypothetical protein